MISEKEKQATLLSPTKKDYYQIWNELLDLASKISDRWTPSETNESDPGIVLLKVLTACADKLNYNIDKNILEAYMPSAAQEESMRKLCEMMGYNMKYYRSATTDVTIYFNKNIDTEFQQDASGVKELILPKFSQISNVDGDVNYLTLSQISFNKYTTSQTVNCIEGTLHYCAEENNRIVTINNIDDNYRYYLPVGQVAENGIFVYNIIDEKQNAQWEQVDNLNTIPLGKMCYKFGYDSKEMLPYLQFPEDIANIIGDGLIIAYIMTNGINGNINSKTLSTFVAPEEWGNTESSEYNRTGMAHAVEDFTCYNISAATNGSDKESLNEAYKNFKQTVGTFDTLITCRDYMNKIYDLTKSDYDTTPLVSNIVVSDIRDDINKSISICSFNEFGINYVDKALITSEDSISTVTILPEPAEKWNNKIVICNSIYYMCLKCNNTYFWGEIDSEKALASMSTKPLIDNFDLVLYPFKTIYKLNTKAEHDNSFKYDKTVYNKITEDLSDNKTISHKFNLPEEDTDFKLPLNNSSEIVAIKNYLKLNARMTTTAKVNPAEQSAIKNAIKTAIYEKFNLRQLDFGEEIPFDEILDTIQNADVRIKNIALDEPVLYTRFLLANNSEYDVAVKYTDSDTNKKLAYENEMKAMMSPAELTFYNDIKGEATTSKSEKQEEYRKDRNLLAKKIYNKLALRNILAGRLNLFNYETEFIPSVTESKASYALIYPVNDKKIKYITSELKINNIPEKADKAVDIKLKENQIVQFSAPNFKTIVTYPAYVNYFLKLNNSESTEAVPATFKRIGDFLIVENEDKSKDYSKFEEFMNTSVKNNAQEIDSEKAKSIITEYGCVFTRTGEDNYVYSAFYGDPSTGTKYYYYPLNKETYGVWFRFISAQIVNSIQLKGIYKNLGSDQSRIIGKMVDINKNKFQLDYVGLTVVNPMDYYFVQDTHESDTDEHTKDGFGRDAVYSGLTANCEYELQKDEYLCINYTNAESEADTSALDAGGSTTIKTTSDVVNIYYGPGTIIRPNAQLIDSKTKRNSGSSWSKTSGFNFEEKLGKDWNNLVEGMYSLGANEQIEIRDVVKVQIYDNTDYSKVYVYFKLNNEKSSGEVEFLPAGTAEEPTSYILQEGEYFWYTDKNKTTLTYCGNGCEIINKTGYAIKKDADAGEVSVEKINESGIEIIPWITLTNLKYDSDKKTGNYIEWVEYQYITLIAGDTLKWIDFNSENTTPDIGHAPKECDDAGYIFDGNEETLPKISVSDASWSVRTKLGINTSPSTPQLLHHQTYVESNDTNLPACEEFVRLFNDKPENIDEYYADESTKLIEVIKSKDNELVSIKTNYTVDETADLIQTAYNLINSSGDEITSVDDFKVKVFIDNEIRIKENQTNSEKLKLNNMNTYYTSLSFADGTCGAQYSTIHCALNDANSQFGIIMMYYTSNSTNQEDLVRLRIKKSDGSSLSIFNNNDEWWDNLSDTTTDEEYNIYYLKPNTTNSVNRNNILNIIKINGNTNTDIFIDAGADEGDILIFSPLRIVNVTSEDEGINLDLLNYYNITPSNSTNNEEDSRKVRALQLLKDIKEKDPNYEFFYNSVVDPSTELDINVYADPQESLSSPRIWYDYNNINNKFVVSEIDTEYLDTGITFASSSTKNY